jgi:hypothetical protein
VVPGFQASCYSREPFALASTSFKNTRHVLFAMSFINLSLKSEQSSHQKTIENFRLPAVIFGAKTQGKKKHQMVNWRIHYLKGTTSLWLSK